MERTIVKPAMRESGRFSNDIQRIIEEFVCSKKDHDMNIMTPWINHFNVSTISDFYVEMFDFGSLSENSYEMISE